MMKQWINMQWDKKKHWNGVESEAKWDEIKCMKRNESERDERQ